jgi:GNAT superfamily N-acetyltransferase
MIDVSPATADENRDWFADWRARVAAWYGGAGVPEWAEQRVLAWTDALASQLYTFRRGRAVLGHLALSVQERFGTRVAIVYDLWTGPDAPAAEIAASARATARGWAAPRAASVGSSLWAPGPADTAFADHPLRAQRMIKVLRQPAPEPPVGLTFRSMRPDEFPAWRAHDALGFAADLTDSGSCPADEARARAEREYASLLPDGLDSPGYTWWVLEADATPVATVWLAEHASPGLSWVYSVEVGPEYRGRGYGRATMRAAEAATLRSGDSRLALNVFGHNTTAMGLYDSLGYTATDQLRTLPVAGAESAGTESAGTEFAEP